ncbi:MAG: aminotransferase class V-fold PLP-dependent enzyme [Lentisphaeria bacterium]|nr:aminotransferase class V-fold PLP-dependent enzyme [Lentisphaeria bacterium]
MIYLDYNATTPCLPECIEAMLPFFGERFGNPASEHPYGREAAEAVAGAAAAVAELIGAEPGQILFTGSATEANNQAVLQAQSGEVVLSTAEHASLYEPARLRGTVRFAAPDAESVIAELTPGTALAALNLANHETGELLREPERIADEARRHGIPLHLDATQAVGKIPVDVRRLGCATMAFSAHKIYGPKGVGALYVREPERCRALLTGGGQQNGLRAGTLNVPGIVGFGAAARRVRHPSPAPRDRFEALLAESGLNGRIVAAHRARLPQTSCVLFPGLNGAKLIGELGEAGLCISSGSACSSGGISRILKAQGADPLAAAGALRISFGRDSTVAEAEEAFSILHRTICKHQISGVIDVGSY